MKGKLLGLAAVAALAVSFASGDAHAQNASAKFAAHVAEAGDNMHLLHSGVADTATPNPDTDEKDCEDGDTFFDYGEAGGVCVKVDNSDTILTTHIKTAKKKDLLVGVSLQSGIYTDTTVKGKNGSSEKAGAEAGIVVMLDVEDEDGNSVDAYPRSVVFAHRIQELSATLGGVIQSCEVSVDDNGDGTINVADDCVVTDEAIGLMLSTTSANHFNFVVPNVGTGKHTVSVYATALASAAFLNGSFQVTDLPDEAACTNAGGVWDPTTSICTIETTDNAAKAWALVDIGTLTVEQVRATNNPDGITIDLDAGS